MSGRKPSLEKILKRLVDGEIDWELHLKDLRQKGMSGEVLRKRVGFCIYCAREKKLDTTQKVSALTRASNWPGYTDKNWSCELVDAENFFLELNSTIPELRKIKYYSREDLHREIEPLNAMNSLSEIGFSKDEAETVTILYGSRLINSFFDDTRIRKNLSLYQLLFSLRNWYVINSINPVRVKERDYEFISRPYR